MNINVRHQLGLIGHAFEQYDEVVQTLISAHWNHLVLSLYPELGTRSGSTVTADDIEEGIEAMRLQYEAAEDVILTLTAADTVEDARALYMRIVTLAGEAERRDAIGVPHTENEVEEVQEAINLLPYFELFGL